MYLKRPAPLSDRSCRLHQLREEILDRSALQEVKQTTFYVFSEQLVTYMWEWTKTTAGSLAIDSSKHYKI